jgi:hypothetical protein
MRIYLAPASARNFFLELLRFVEIPNVGASDAARGLQFPMHDIEDALQASSALAFNADYIISRNVKDYRRSPVPAIAPKGFISKTGAP